MREALVAGGAERPRVPRPGGEAAPERLLCELLAALASDTPALERAVALLIEHPHVRYAGLEVGLAAGDPRERLWIDRARAEGDPQLPALHALAGDPTPARAIAPEFVAPGVQLWRAGARLPFRLRRQGAMTAIRIAGPDGALLLAGVAELALPAGVRWCRGVASAIALALARLRAESELQQAERVLLAGELSAAATHDIGNVLTGVVGFSALLREQIPVGHPARRYVDLIDDLGASGIDLARQVLGFARAERAERAPVAVNALVTTVRDIAAAIAPARITLALDLAAPGPVVPGERTLLEQALMNLVLNAIDAMPDGGRILLRTRTLERAPWSAGDALCDAVIDVVDEGCGIAPEVLPLIFRSLYTSKPPGRGTGLGLTSVQRIVRRHGGSVEVTSAPGSGSTFTLRLPVRERRDLAGDRGVEPRLTDPESGVLPLDESPVLSHPSKA